MVVRRLRSGTRPPGALLAVLLLLLFGGSAALAQQPAPPADAGTHGSPVGGPHHPGPSQQLHGAIAHPAHAATHAPLPLLPAAVQDEPAPDHVSLPSERPRLSAAHLTHRSPLRGRAPPPGIGT